MKNQLFITFSRAKVNPPVKYHKELLTKGVHVELLSSPVTKSIFGNPVTQYPCIPDRYKVREVEGWNAKQGKEVVLGNGMKLRLN